MKFCSSNRIDTIDEAVRLVLRQAGPTGMSAEVVELFLPSTAGSGLRTDAEIIVDTEVHREYGRNARWRGSHWIVPIPQLRFEAAPAPLLQFTIQKHLAAGLTILVDRNSYPTSLVGPAGKPERLKLPMEFLQALLDERLDQFEIAAKGGTDTTWTLPSFPGPLCLPDEFLEELSWQLQRKSVASWLLTFGAPGRSLMPQVVGSLLGLQYRAAAQSGPAAEQSWALDVVMETLTRMFGAAKAKAHFSQAQPYLKADMNDEAAIRLVLRMAGKEQ